jgi:hypothetical protein
MVSGRSLVKSEVICMVGDFFPNYGLLEGTNVANSKK